MGKKIQSIKGFYDVSPKRQKLWRFFESKILNILDQYSYEEIGGYSMNYYTWGRRKIYII